MSSQMLEGKTALITGSTQGIGLAIAVSLAGAGCRIAMHGLGDAQQIDEASAAIQNAGSPELRYFDADLRDVEAITSMMKSVADWGGVDILVNNAGIQKTAPLGESDPGVWNDILAINLSAAFHTMRLSMPLMRERRYGRVINVASVHGLVGSVEKSPYVASKFGLVGLSRVAALEYADAGSRESGGVTVNCVCPGWTETAMVEPQIEQRAAQTGGDRQSGVAGLLSEKQPSLRMSDPAEIGSFVVWLCDRQAHNMTGTSIPIDGGWTAQ